MSNSLKEKVFAELEKDGNTIHDYGLLVKFDHHTNNGMGIYIVTLVFKPVGEVFRDYTFLLKKLGLAKMNRSKTQWVMTESQRANLEYYCPELYQLKL